MRLPKPHKFQNTTKQSPTPHLNYTTSTLQLHHTTHTRTTLHPHHNTTTSHHKHTHHAGGLDAVVQSLQGAECLEACSFLHASSFNSLSDHFLLNSFLNVTPFFRSSFLLSFLLSFPPLFFFFFLLSFLPSLLSSFLPLFLPSFLPSFIYNSSFIY